MNRMDIKNKKHITVLLEVTVTYDSEQYERLRDAADETASIIENATDVGWDEFLHIRSVKVRDFR